MVDRHNGIQDWVITLIGSADTLKELRKKELYWMYKLKTYAPHGLNERVFTTNGFLGVAIESWPEWDLNPRPLNSVQNSVYIYIHNIT